MGGVPEFLARVPEGFFTLFAGEYNWVFIVAFMLYNLFFLGGNWAYVQRYTSVRTPRDAKKVGVLFGVLYTFSPILWMLPPMIYRVFEPGLSGLENENAYLLMCKQTMPAGMLGLMLGGMIFATASSLNATLNISAGVFTNDIFKRLRPRRRRDDADESCPHLHARLRGAGHRRGAAHPQHGRHRQRRNQRGGTHRSAPLPAADLEPLLQEPERRAILSTTVTSLTVNAVLKFIMPAAVGFSLSRAEEMLVGVLFPALLLVGYEIYHKLSGSRVCVPMPAAENAAAPAAEDAGTDNNNSIRIIGAGAAISGCFISLIALLSGGETLVPLTMGIVLTVLGGLIFLTTKNK